MESKKNCQAIRYTKEMKLQQILNEPGDSINIFIPAEIVTADYQTLVENRIWGPRPYSIDSDLVAIVVHMGILFPSEKPKKSSPNLLYTSQNALKFGKTENLDLSDTKRVDDDYKFYGVVVTVCAKEKLTSYQGVQGFFIVSGSHDEEENLSVDIIDFHFITEYDPMPEIIENPADIIKKYDIDQIKEVDANVEGLVFTYKQEIFSVHPELLFRDFQFLIQIPEGLYEINTNENLIRIFKVTVNQETEEEEKTSIQKDIPIEKISFDEKGMKIGEVEFYNILHFQMKPQAPPPE